METTNTNHTEQSSTKTTEKMVNDTNKGMMNIFTQNLNAVTDFYSNLLNSFLNSNKGFNNNYGASTNYLNNDFAKLFSNPYNGMGNSFSLQTLPTFNNVFQQMIDYNTSLFSMLSKGMDTNTDWTQVGKKEEQIIENRLEATKNMRHSILESYNKQLDNVNENNKKMMQETTDQYNLLMQQNQKLLSEMFSINKDSTKTEEKQIKDLIVKEPILSEAKKRTAFPLDHKH